jgi:hypothetical protein
VSELTRCNRCTLMALAKKGLLVIRPKKGELGGYDISILYPPSEDYPYEPVWAAWMMTLPNLCAC